MRILQLSSALPKNRFSTAQLMENFPCELPENVKQNILNLGVSQRHLIDHEAPKSKSEQVMDEAALVDLCTQACGKAVEKSDLSIKDIRYFVAAYDVNPFLSPGLSQLLVRQVGFDPYVKHVNVQGVASTAFPKALELAENRLAGHPNDHVLICVSGVSSFWFHNQVQGLREVMEISQIGKLTSRAKRQLELRKWIATMEYFLFGDGAVACVVGKKEGNFSIGRIVEVTNVGKRDYLAGYTRLCALDEPFRFGLYSHLGKEIPELGARYATLALKKLLGKDFEDRIKAAKKWAVHTGSEKILNAIAKRHGIQEERLRESHEILREYGNLAGASLPFILERIVSTNTFADGDAILMVGYGWGFSAAATTLEYEAETR
jgi:predicted naringenin-chalcone synthase